MRILVYGLNFAPEVTGTGKYTGEMVQWLVDRGHEVRVVTAPPYYPQWRVASGFSTWRYTRTQHSGGPDVWRAPLWVPARPSGPKRILHLMTFALASLPVLLWQAFWRPQVVVVVVPTLLTAPGGWLAARLGGGKAWIHIQDFEVDAAFDLNVLRQGWWRRLAHGAESVLLRGFDQVSTISEKMLARLPEKGVATGKCALFPNWVDAQAIYPLPTASPFRKKLGIADDTVVALYSGNMGRKQGLEILADVAARLSGEPGITFVLAGAGESRTQLQALTVGLDNVRWLPLQPAERLNELLNLADIHLLPQCADAAELVMPSKLTGMLASGRPVVATAAESTQLAAVVAGRGLVVPPDDPDAFSRAILELTRNVEMRRALGIAGRNYAEEHLNREVILHAFETALQKLIARTN